MANDCRKDRQAGKSRQLFPFQWLLAKPGGAGVSTCTLGAGSFFANFAESLAIFAVKSF
jgi:hypothetical protein